MRGVSPLHGKTSLTNAALDRNIRHLLGYLQKSLTALGACTSLGPAMEMARSRFAGSCILLGGAQTQESAMPPSASERACDWLGLFLLHVDGAEQVRGICATESIMRNRVDLGGHFRFQGLLANLT